MTSAKSSLHHIVLACALTTALSATAAHAQTSGVTAGDAQRTTLHGFADVGYRTGGRHTGRTSGFSLGQLDLFLTSQLTERISFLSESVFEYEDETNEFHVDVERVIVQLAVNEHFRLNAGKMHTPLGYWSNAFHHGLVIQPTITRPQVVQFEETGGPLPIHTLGVQLSGRDLGEAHLGFDVLLGNGRGNRASPDGRNDAQALAVSLHSQLTSSLRVGVSGYRDRVAVGSPNARGNVTESAIVQTISGGFLSYFGDRAQAVLEGHRVANATLGHTTTSPGWFGYAGWRLGERLVPYAVHDELTLASDDPYFEAGRTRREILGMRHELASTVVSKLELRSVDHRGLPRATELAAQLAIAF